MLANSSDILLILFFLGRRSCWFLRCRSYRLRVLLSSKLQTPK